MHAHAIQLNLLRRHAWSRRRVPSRLFRIAARCVCLVALLLLCAAIGAYIYWTEPHRVRALAEGFLSRVIDGDISIGHAQLSIFEGLQLDDVQISLRRDLPSVRNAPRTVISAKRLQISYSTLSLLRGRLESGRVTAIEPEINLVEDVATGRWNVQSLFQRPSRPRTTTTGPSFGTRAPTLPEVLIRGARVHRAQITAAGTYEPLQTVLLEGQLLPRAAHGAYQFNLQSRTDQGTAGPAFQGEFSLADGVARSSLKNVDLTFLEPMLPARVRDFWRKLSPHGRVDVPVLSVSRSTLNPDGTSTGQAGFHLELRVDDVNMVVRLADLASQRDQAVLAHADDVSRAVQRLPHGSIMSVATAVAPGLRGVGEVPLDHVAGRFVFTERGITLHTLTATIDGNDFQISGSMGGYTFDSPLTIELKSPQGNPIELRERLPYINALPAEIREIYYRFRPRGRANLDFALRRAAAGSPLTARGTLEFASTAFEFDQFRYPIRNASGKLTIDTDPRTNEPRLIIDDVHGNGPINGPNANGQLHVAGVIAPLIGYASVEVDVSGHDIHAEPRLISALPPEASSVIQAFDDDGPTGPNPVFQGDFICRVRRAPGPISRWSYDTDVNVRHGHGSFQEFPYPLEDFSADIRVRKDYVEIANGRTTHGGGVIELSGLSEWGSRLTVAATDPSTQPTTRRVGDPSVRTQLTVNAHNVPIDDALRRALPPEARETLDRFGIRGTADIAGPIDVFDPRHPKFDLAVAVHNGHFQETDWKTAIDQIEATVRLTPTLLTLEQLGGKRGDAVVSAKGSVDWSTPQPTLAIEAHADGLQLDASLRDSLPNDARSVWDSLKPAGTTGATLTLNGLAATPTWSLDLHPTGAASVTADFLPLPATELDGTVHADVSHVVMTDLRGNIAGGTATINGTGEIGERQAWTLAFSSIGTHIDLAFCHAIPEALGKTLLDNAVAGVADLDVRRLAWTRSPDGKSTDTVFDATVTMHDTTWTAGVTVDHANGTLALRGHFVDDDPETLSGTVAFPTLRIAGLDATDGAATINSNADERRIAISDVRAKIGDGELAGSLGLDRRRPDLTRWQADFLLRNASVASLVGNTDNAPKVSGLLSASLSIEGAYGDSAARASAAFPRRGRGDISVSGENMLHVPMVVGMTQVVSLALPFTGGFNEATASYSLDGDRVRFGEIDLQSNEMRIKGSGWLDFGSKQLNLDFVTDTNGKKLPVIGGLLDAARRELLQIHVRGSLSEPEVKAGTLRTITTTIDEIMNGDEKR